MQRLREWLPAVAGMACLGLGAGLIGIFGFFIAPLSAEFGVSATVLGIAPVALLLLPALISPLVGRLVDRLPVRRMLLIGVTVAMGSLLAVSQAPTLFWLAACFLCFSFGLGFYSPVVVNAMLVRQYVGREARALAIAAIGISFATAILPPLTGFLLEAGDWRSTVSTLALGIFTVLVLCILAGVPARQVAAPTLEAHHALDRVIYRRPAFWLIGFCVALGLSVNIVLALCYPPHFANLGYSLVEAGSFMSVGGIAGLCGKTMIATIADRVRHHAKWLAAGVLSTQILGLSVLLMAETPATIVLGVALSGFGGGAFLPVHPFLNSRYFHASVIGEVNGAQMPMILPFALMGPPLAGWAFDTTASYAPALGGLAVALLAALLLAMALPASGMGSPSQGTSSVTSTA